MRYLIQKSEDLGPKLGGSSEQNLKKKEVVMKSLKIFFTAFFMCFVLSESVIPQTSQFDLTEYQQFLEQHQNMASSQLLEMYPTGLFIGNVQTSWESALYHDSIEIKYELTEYEKSLIQKHDFMVTERLRKESFGEHFADIWEKDLPVFVSTDAILHAFHFSYDRILRDVELRILINRVAELLDQLHSELPDLAAIYSSNSEMEQMLKDVDVYITVPRKLLDPSASPYYTENIPEINTILNLISAEQFDTYPFFSENCKLIDFSQFKPRGHYVDEEHPELARYFRAMMWLGRIEVYLLAPKADSCICPPQSPADIQRQTIDAVLISELMDLANANAIYEEIEDIIYFFVGEQDNVTPPNLRSLIQSMNLTDASQLLDTLVLNEFQDLLKTKSFAFQRILSQVLMHDPMSPDAIVPASAFMLFGQRFVIDSYVTGSVVFDRIKYNGWFPCRLFPSTLDILFALGNDASAQFLTPELDEYHYSTNLAGLRYLIDAYDSGFWNNTIYNMWLNSIRTLNPPTNRDNLPSFMQTAAWWQEKINTQLSSWTELRHDNLLYAKQSYTGGYQCSYPYSYVEPIPEFYQNMKLIAETAKQKFQNVAFTDNYRKDAIINYFETLEGVTDTLDAIAQKELTGTAFTTEEISFLQGMLSTVPNCWPTFDGWYPRLFYNDPYLQEGFFKDYLVVDYHTTPTDCFGNMMGWVLHAGTGPVDLAIVTATLPDNQTVAFVGPVMSYYEYTTTNFQRLTDDEWTDTYLQSALRPTWVNLYLADSSGESRGDGPSLWTSVTGVDDKEEQSIEIPTTHIIAQNYPNPFNASTEISFTVPYDMINSPTELTIYNIQGQVVKRLLKKELPSRNYLTRWNGTNDLGESVSSGIYFYEVKVGSQKYVGKMNLLK